MLDNPNRGDHEVIQRYTVNDDRTITDPASLFRKPLAEPCAAQCAPDRGSTPAPLAARCPHLHPPFLRSIPGGESGISVCSACGSWLSVSPLIITRSGRTKRKPGCWRGISISAPSGFTNCATRALQVCGTPSCGWRNMCSTRDMERSHIWEPPSHSRVSLHCSLLRLSHAHPLADGIELFLRLSVCSRRAVLRVVSSLLFCCCPAIPGSEASPTLRAFPGSAGHSDRSRQSYGFRAGGGLCLSIHEAVV